MMIFATMAGVLWGSAAIFTVYKQTLLPPACWIFALHLVFLIPFAVSFYRGSKSNREIKTKHGAAAGYVMSTGVGALLPVLGLLVTVMSALKVRKGYIGGGVLHSHAGYRAKAARQGVGKSAVSYS